MKASNSEQKQEFLDHLYTRIFKWCYEYQERYRDTRRHGESPPLTFIDHIKHSIKVFAALKFRCAARQFSLPTASRELSRITMQADEHAAAYTLLADAYSRQVFLDILAFRVLGGAHVRLPLNTATYWKNYDKDLPAIQQNTFQTATGFSLNKYRIPGNTGDLYLHTATGCYQYYFLSKAYEYNKEGHVISIKPGDIVIDGGGCWGETAIYFADYSAPDGKIYSFEFDPDNLRILNANLELNARLASRIECVQNAISDVSDIELGFQSRGPGTRVQQIDTNTATLESIRSLSIDDFVARRNLDRVNFIKLDIEGWELNGLRGAEKTLKTFKPRLAISAYHRSEDLFTLVTYLHGLNLGYQFYMDHFTVHNEETVLFAISEAPPL